MNNYKGYYIDHVMFNNKAEIDEFIKNQSIKSYKQLVKLFCNNPTMARNVACCDQAERLNKQFGMSWADIEDIEIAAMA